MQTISCTNARNQLTRLMESVVNDRQPISITRHGTAVVILLAAPEYEAMEETLYLLSTPANAQQLLQGLADDGNGIRTSLGLSPRKR
jgi:antitoxin YefM